MSDDETPVQSPDDDGDFVSATQQALYVRYGHLTSEIERLATQRNELNAAIKELRAERKRVERLVRATLPRGVKPEPVP